MNRLFIAAVLIGCSGSEPVEDVEEVAAGDELLDGKADSAGETVELKWTLDAGDFARAKKVFKLASATPSRREITFYDGPELELFEAGVVLRSRKLSKAPDDSTVKLRPLDPSEVDEGWFGVEGFKCEEDRSPTKSVSSCSLTVRQDDGEIDDVADGEREISKLFSDDQEEFFAGYSMMAIDIDALEILGPADAEVWSVKVKSLNRKLTIEHWVLDGELELLEVSTRATPQAADDVLDEVTGYLDDKGFDTESAQETKTRAALEYFAAGR